MFNNNIYNLESLVIYEYFLKSDFKFMIINNNKYYSKDSLFEFKKLSKFFCKTIITNWVRVIFRGKGYRLRKFKGVNKLTFNFGHSHWAKMALNSNNFFFKKLRRQNYLCLIKQFNQLNGFQQTIKSVKKLNVYTKRGLRLKRQYIKRRFGKISQVVSSLH
jgi:hypothetical protein